VICEIEEIIGLDCSNIIRASAKMGLGIEETLEAIVERIPPPKNTVKVSVPLLLLPLLLLLLHASVRVCALSGWTSAVAAACRRLVGLQARNMLLLSPWFWLPANPCRTRCAR
jgi:hypothetical protein